MADRPSDPTDEMLIAYVNGKLPRDDSEQIALEAAQRPELAAEITLMRGIATAVREEARGPSPRELGWARLSRALDAEEKKPASRSRRRSLWQLAASAAAAVLIWQAVAVPILSLRGDEPGYAPVSEQSAGEFSLSVAFEPEATEEAIRLLLREIDARISDGPSAIGLWRLSFGSAAARDAGLARLRAAAIVESAQEQ